MNLINGIGFQTIANHIIDVNRRDAIMQLKNGDIIWCKTDYLDLLFQQIKNNTSNVILITHCSDHAITKDIYNQKPNNIKKWYAQNVDHIDSNLIPLPIGIENHEGPNKGSSIDMEYMKKNSFDFTIKNKIINRLHTNFSLHTHYNRPNVYNILKSKNLIYPLQKSPFPNYCEDMKKFLFVASPRGNGIDCHRTWEALYLGCIPIVEKHYIYDTFALPIIQITNWNELSQEFLNNYINLYKNNIFTEDVIKKLTLEYWCDLILRESKCQQ